MSVYTLFRVLGSLAMPLFAYAFATGFLRTRNSGRYFIRLALFATLTQAIMCFLFPLAGIPLSMVQMNALYILLLAFGVLYGMEILMRTAPDRIASLHLLQANANTHSDRFDLCIGDGDKTTHPMGLRIPPWPPATLQIAALGLIVFCITLPVFLPIEYGLFGVLTVLIFYSVEKWISQNKAVAAFLSFLMLDLTIIFLNYRLYEELPFLGASIAAVFICYIPLKEKRPPRAIKYAFYFLFPLHILIIILIRFLIV